MERQKEKWHISIIFTFFKIVTLWLLLLSLFIVGLSDTKDLLYMSHLPAYLKDDSKTTWFTGSVCFLCIVKYVLFMAWCDNRRLPWCWTIITTFLTHSWTRWNENSLCCITKPCTSHNLCCWSLDGSLYAASHVAVTQAYCQSLYDRIYRMET